MTNNNTSPFRDRETAPRKLESNPPLRILVVDNDISTRQLSAEVLIRSGYGVDCAANGAAAWQALNSDSYDLLIAEYHMPKVSGVELLKKARAARMALPVILATRALPKEEFTRFPWLQTAATVLKPFTADELLATVRKVLRAPTIARDNSNPRSSA